MRRIVICILLTIAAAFAQSDRTIWQPPTLDLPDTLPHATVAKEMITKLRVSKMQIILEETPLSGYPEEQHSQDGTATTGRE